MRCRFAGRIATTTSGTCWSWFDTRSRASHRCSCALQCTLHCFSVATFYRPMWFKRCRGKGVRFPFGEKKPYIDMQGVMYPSMAKQASHVHAWGCVSLVCAGTWYRLARGLARNGKGKTGFWGELPQSCDAQFSHVFSSCANNCV